MPTNDIKNINKNAANYLVSHDSPNSKPAPKIATPFVAEKSIQTNLTAKLQKLIDTPLNNGINVKIAQLITLSKNESSEVQPHPDLTSPAQPKTEPNSNKSPNHPEGAPKQTESAKNLSSQVLEKLPQIPDKQMALVAQLHNSTKSFNPEQQKAVLSFLKENNIPFDAKNPPKNPAQLKQVLTEYLSKQGIPDGPELNQAVAQLMEHLVGQEKPQGPQEQPKLNWGEFVDNALGSGNFSLEEAQVAAQLIQELKVLGVGKNELGEFLVANLKVLSQGNPEEIKFALLKLGESLKMGGAELMALLKNPQMADQAGQQILQLLQKNMGEVGFLKLMNAAQQAQDPKVAPFDPKQISPEALASLERWFNSEKKSSKMDDLGFYIRPDGSIGWRGQGKENSEGAFANPYELLNLKESYRGRQKFYTFVAYAAISSLITLAFLLVIFKMA